MPPGDGYTVTVEESRTDAYTVRVLSRDKHPDASFYSSQKLEPTRGYIKTRDGTLLSYRIVLPDQKAYGKGPYDLIITYSGYQPGLETKDGYQNKPFAQFSALGYAVAGVNMRASGCSGGAFDFMEPVTWLDGYDMIEAFAAQPWVDDVTLGDQSRAIKTHPYDGTFWQSRSAQVAKIKVPTLQIVSWQDPQVGSRPAILAELFPAGASIRLVGVNGFHQYYSGAVWDEIVEFLDVHLGDDGPDKIAQYESQNDFLVLLESDSQGKVRGRFTLPNFAAAGAGRRMLLGSDLQPKDADESGAWSRFTYDPVRPSSWAAPVQGSATFTSDALRE